MTLQESIQIRVYRRDSTRGVYMLDSTIGDSAVISASIKRQCSADSSVEIGGAYAATLNLQARMELGRGRAPKIGRSTEEAMRFGALVGYRGMVREIVATLRANFGEDFKLVATGGFARWALKGLDLPFVIDPTLTLYGAGLVCGRGGEKE